MHRLGPLRPKRTQSCPAARLGITAGMKEGGIPLTRGVEAKVRSIRGTPPMPTPRKQPNLSLSKGTEGLPSRYQPACSIASIPPTTAYWMNASILWTSTSLK